MKRRRTSNFRTVSLPGPRGNQTWQSGPKRIRFPPHDLPDSVTVARKILILLVKVQILVGQFSLSPARWRGLSVAPLSGQPFLHIRRRIQVSVDAWAVHRDLPDRQSAGPGQPVQAGACGNLLDQIQQLRGK